MGSLVCHGNSDSEEFGHKLCLYSLNYEESGIEEHEQCNSMKKEKSLKAILLDDLNIASTYENDGLMVQELGVDLESILHVHETPVSKQDSICNGKAVQKDLSQYAMLLYSEMDQMVQPFPFAFDVEEGLSSTSIDNLLEADSSTSTCSTTPPTTPKVLSAIKGSRAEHGTPPETKLSVKWAPEVYDPPVTSDSHTVKGHHRVHYRAKKDPHKQKPSKSKSSRATVFDRKHGHRSITITRS